MKNSISFLVKSCLVLFSQIVEKIEQSEYNKLHGKDVPVVSWIDELGRLRIWAANIGAHQTGQSSLDFRLRDSSHISDEIVDLLNDLSGRLDEIAVFLSDDTNSGTHLETDPMANFLDEPLLTEIQQLYEQVVTIVKCLYQMSMLLRNPARHNLLAESVPDDILMSDQWDRQHVSNKFSQADNIVIEHLGRAITRRRRYLKYRERHSAKLSRGLEHDLDTEAQTMSSTMATDYKADIVDPEDTASNSGFSQTSYAPSLFEGGNVTIPPLPKESLAGNPFVCPYCYFVVDVHNTRSWTRHIFKDLKPYSCTFPDCRTIDRLYTSRTEWFFHVSNNHDVSNLQCPLCKDSLISSKSFEHHVARHLEELALFVLPRMETDVGEEHDNEALSIDSQSEHNSATESSHHKGIEGEAVIDEESDIEIPASSTYPGPSPSQIVFDNSPLSSPFTTSDNETELDDYYEDQNRITKTSGESKVQASRRLAGVFSEDELQQSHNTVEQEQGDIEASQLLGAKGILKEPKDKFPEDSTPIREGVLPPRDKTDIPPNARWTKIDRKLVNLQALEEKGERYEESGDFVIVLRVLTKEEIEVLADRTRTIRSTRGRLSVDSDMETEDETIIYERKWDEHTTEREKSKEEENFRKRMKEMYLSQGYSEGSIDITIEKEKHRRHANSYSSDEEVPVPTTKNIDTEAIDSYMRDIKVHRKYLSPETLDAYNLPWEWDNV
ncbi:MAG: hypothetical protein LQ342_003199 [Letrouitia transgressa]|nr:MAG: hypothetical protein LQ342_003199 [Letrouitia transgressa]